MYLMQVSQLNHMEEKKEKYVTVRIPPELADDVDKLIGKHGFRSRAEVAKESLRRLIAFYKSEPRLQHFNLNEDGVLILDRTLSPNRIVQVYFKPDGVKCELCDSSSCRHVKYALSKPAVKEILREKGWNNSDYF